MGKVTDLLTVLQMARIMPRFCLALGPQTPQLRPSLPGSGEPQPQGQSGYGLEGSFLMLSEGISLVSSPRCDLIGASERVLLGGLSGEERLLGPQQSHQLRFLGTRVAWPTGSLLALCLQRSPCSEGLGEKGVSYSLALKTAGGQAWSCPWWFPASAWISSIDLVVPRHRNNAPRGNQRTHGCHGPHSNQRTQRYHGVTQCGMTFRSVSWLHLTNCLTSLSAVPCSINVEVDRELNEIIPISARVLKIKSKHCQDCAFLWKEGVVCPGVM